MTRAVVVSPLGALLLFALTGACGGSDSPTTGSVEGYLYVSTDCSSTAGPPYIITDSTVPPASYKALADTGVSIVSLLPEHRMAGTKTGRDGHFAFGSLPAGSYQVISGVGDARQVYFFPSFFVTVENGKTSRRFETPTGPWTVAWAYDCESRVASPLKWFEWEPQLPPPRDALSHVVIEAERSIECPIRAETDDFGHVAIGNLQAGSYKMMIPLPACGITVFCAFGLPGNGEIEILECDPTAPTGALQPPEALPSTGETP